jgi:hypothetical protein
VGEVSWNEKDRELGLNAGRLATVHQLLVMQTPVETIEPQISFVAKRSILYYHGDDAVRVHLRKYGGKEAIIVQVNAEREILGVRKLAR